jgi:hypothetical protein
VEQSTANEAIRKEGTLKPNKANINKIGYYNTLHHGSFY